ncbi:MAG: leucyl aminopeptidase family protein, partial [Planctomycetota bacterium]
DAFGADVSVITGDDLLDQNFPMIHTVGRAADRAPRLIDMAWGNGGPKLTLVGKGVVFDTGGLNIKPGNSMMLMKKDMGGAAATLATARLIMETGLPVRLRVLIPAVENAVAGNAFRPGDVLPSHAGITVEIGNTDAEGRLVLADALSLADGDEPDLVISLATLTGSARVALGPDLPAFYATSDDVAAAMEKSAHDVHDPFWRMPFWDGYEGTLKSPVADVCHISTGPFAGSITAALFLRRFVKHAATYAHLDMYGWTPSAKPGRPAGGEAQCARAIHAYLSERYGRGASR